MSYHTYSSEICSNIAIIFCKVTVILFEGYNVAANIWLEWNKINFILSSIFNKYIVLCNILLEILLIC